MTADEAVAAFSAMAADRQIAVLARYAFEMTILARGTYLRRAAAVFSFTEAFSSRHRRDRSRHAARRRASALQPTIRWSSARGGASFTQTTPAPHSMHRGSRPCGRSAPG